MPGMERILVHSCCASCASYVLEHLKQSFDVVALFYNPNIHPESEYRLRLGEMRELCKRLDLPLIEGRYDPHNWWQIIEPYKHLPERSERCFACYRMRLEKAAEVAEDIGADLFTTTLSVSPHKNYKWIKKIGDELAERTGVRFHDEDFKKRDGFKKSVKVSKALGLTRQDYCGCLLSLKESFERNREIAKIRQSSKREP